MGTHPIFESDFDCLTGWGSPLLALPTTTATDSATSDTESSPARPSLDLPILGHSETSSSAKLPDGSVADLLISHTPSWQSDDIGRHSSSSTPDPVCIPLPSSVPRPSVDQE